MINKKQIQILEKLKEQYSGVILAIIMGYPILVFSLNLLDGDTKFWMVLTSIIGLYSPLVVWFGFNYVSSLIQIKSIKDWIWDIIFLTTLPFYAIWTSLFSTESSYSYFTLSKVVYFTFKYILPNLSSIIMLSWFINLRKRASSKKQFTEHIHSKNLFVVFAFILPFFVVLNTWVTLPKELNMSLLIQIMGILFYLIFAHALIYIFRKFNVI